MAGFGDAEIPSPQYVAVDVELDDGDTLDGWGEPVQVLGVPGHTPGSIALHLPASHVLFPGDIIATGDGRAVLGPFNVNREEAIASSFRKLATLDVETFRMVSRSRMGQAHCCGQPPRNLTGCDHEGGSRRERCVKGAQGWDRETLVPTPTQ
ncbi:MBL fold metallo-hydrolase [Streptomyces sp. NPDC008343]|uniref:MBL fold metallo-hydrolase n=1 Tax=Streptomyces sp. NPDC008343 TaxID=3364828 RepID=UPI0036E27DD8